MSQSVFAVAVGVAICVAVSPYLARLTVSVPDRANRTWWRGAAVSPARRLTTVATGASFGALAGLAAGWGAALPALLAFALFATPLAIIDQELHRLPDRLVFPAAVAAAVLLAFAAAIDSDWRAYLRAVEAAAAVLAVLFTVAFAAPSAFGFGDVKLGAVVGAYLGWAGWAWVYYGIFAGFLLGSLVGVSLLVAGRASRKTPIPFGPALIVGALTVLAVAERTSWLG